MPNEIIVPRDIQPEPVILSVAAPITYHHISPNHGRVGTRIFDDIYGVYETGFPHGARDKPFFAEMGKLNHRVSVQSQWGPAQYEVAYAKRGHKIIASAMYIVIAAPIGGWRDSDYHAAIGIDYRSVLPEAQGLGIAGKFEKLALDRARDYAVSLSHVAKTEDAKLLVFNEMSMPLRMPFAAFREDVETVKTHPFKRVEIWNKAGLLRVMPRPGIHYYIEPKAVDGSALCDYYSANFKIAENGFIGTQTVTDILTRYAAIRRMRGQDPRKDKRFYKMLDKAGQFDVLNAIKDIDAIRPLWTLADSVINESRGSMPHGFANRRMISLIRERFPDAPVPAFT